MNDKSAAQVRHVRQSNRAGDDLEQEVRDAVHLLVEQPSAPSDPDDDGSPERVRTQLNAALDLASQHVVNRIRRLRKQCDELEQLILSDCGRVKAEIHQHVELANKAAAQSDAVEAVLKNLRADRARLIKANVSTVEE